MTPLFRVRVDFRAVLIFSSEDHNLSTNPSRTTDFDGKLDNFVTLMEFALFSTQDHARKDLSQFQRKSAHAPQKELPKRKL